MAGFDDHPLDRPAAPEAPRARPPAGAIVAALLLLAAAGFVARWWWDRGRPAAPEAPRAAARAGTPAADSQPAASPAVELPPLDEMDPFLRALLGVLSARPELARWLATDNLIRQLAVAIDRVSRGVSPAAEFGVLAPRAPYPVIARQGRVYADPAGYRRYDGLAATVASLDMAAVARAYRTIQPRLDEAYRALGRAGGVDRAVAAGLAILLDTPVPPDTVELRFGEGPNYAYVDPALEGLLPAQKHLLRMGPAHVRTIKAKIDELSKALAP